MILYCATGNPGKLREFRLVASPGWEVQELPGRRDLPAPRETGFTFEENASIKARYYGSHTPGWLFVDDSGLEVDALGGEPGVNSAYFAGPDASDAENNALLLEKLRNAPDRTARYVCVIALARDGQVIQLFRGEVEGRIELEPRGTGGFGYDPYFFYPPLGCTFGEATMEQKQQVSHRGRALARMFDWLRAQ
ncbi:MAG: RdgB/HAM1 family non-canonical purine NTP pyrophosphatase [Bryobacteraceae bacterium]|nr:RdgB/HAM1 family non-canonical purine NTP pyrophosphatase [Bryobacteraceae bacterium]